MAKRATTAANKKSAEEVEPVTDETEDEKPLREDQVKVAEGTDFERVFTLKIPRGKKHRKLHRKVLLSFSTLDPLMRGGNNNEGMQLGLVIEALEKTFGIEQFETMMVPFVLGITEKDDLEYLDQLLPLELFTAYMEAATYFVSGGQRKEVQAALKK